MWRQNLGRRQKKKLWVVIRWHGNWRMPEHWQSPVAAGIGMSQLWGWGSRCGWLIPQNMPRGEIGYQWPLTLQSKLSHLIEGTWFCLHICGLLLESRGSQKSRHLDRLSKVLTDFESCTGRKLNPKVISLVIGHAVFQDQACMLFGPWQAGQVILNGECQSREYSKAVMKDSFQLNKTLII